MLSNNPNIPKHFHFVFALKPQIEPFHLMHYLCLKSCIDVNNPDMIFFHYHYEPFGDLWDKIRPGLTLIKVDLVDFVINHPGYTKHQEGLFIKHTGLDYAHQADFLRLQILLDQGGVYADMDTLFVNPIPVNLFQEKFVIGRESDLDVDGVSSMSLCNALMMSAAGSAFIEKWLDRSYTVFDGSWSRHSCQEASVIAMEYPEDVYIVPERYFYRHMWTIQGLEDLFVNRVEDLEDVYSFHLWSHLWWDETRTDFTTFHGNLITEQYIRHEKTTYSAIANRFLD